MKSRTWMWSTAMCLFAALAITVQTSAQSQMITSDCPAKSKFTTFDPPGSTYTIANSINAAGAITGYYVDAYGYRQGFLRAADGTITTIDPPGSIYTNPSSINLWGAITGWYDDASYTQHGFLRSP